MPIFRDMSQARMAQGRMGAQEIGSGAQMSAQPAAMPQAGVGGGGGGMRGQQGPPRGQGILGQRGLGQQGALKQQGQQADMQVHNTMQTGQLAKASMGVEGGVQSQMGQELGRQVAQAVQGALQAQGGQGRGGAVAQMTGGDARQLLGQQGGQGMLLGQGGAQESLGQQQAGLAGMNQGMGMQGSSAVASQGHGGAIDARLQDELALRKRADAGLQGGAGGMLGGRAFFA